jgi:transposase-like protein
VGPHSGWPYPTGDPIPSEDEMRSQAGQILAELSKGKSIRTVAREMGIDRNTLRSRLKLISHPLPDAPSLRAIIFERSEHLIERLSHRIDTDEIATADLVRATGELRALLGQQAGWFSVDTSPDVPDESDPRVDEWVAEAASENEAELREVRGG